MLASLEPFVWFLDQSVTVGGLGAVWFLVPFLGLLAGLGWTSMRAEPIEYWKLSLLGVLPLIWIATGVWGAHFWVHWERPPVVPNPQWVHYPILFGICVYTIVAIGLILYLRGARWFVSLFALLNLYFMLAMTFLASMAVTGDWL